ncbi:MAG TPA: DUF4350 domain-containing protein [Pyrinomonadaceae bacterium]|nr:DUF4350 domain-containing protein [Pyrinomonadaceae bacterium]
MRQRLTIILTVIVILGALVVLNTITYVKKEKPLDTELAPNRSTYHSGPTGTRALYDFLSESGFRVIRWREAPDRLLTSGANIRTFVIVGSTQLPFSEEHAEPVLAWVANGGRLVLIDREPPRFLVPKSGDWLVNMRGYIFPMADIDPSDPKVMTETVTALRPVQPTLYTQNVQNVLPSRFAARVRITPTTPPSDEKDNKDTTDDSDVSPAPVVHVADEQGPLLVDYPHGFGRIVILSDPYIVANGGIELQDNLQLAVNTITSADGLIAFDEYHQGRGVTRNALATYFAGTPVLPIAAQIVLLILLILWTRGRRFGRALPLVQVDRRSSLEFVASMAELQERSRAFDLAIENIYSRTRRVLARHAGVDYNSPRTLIATRVASRSSLDAHKLETLMRQCEETINGGAINWRQAIDLVRRLREVERTLGLGMRLRESRQAAESI